jgi:hypothetical protein
MSEPLIVAHVSSCQWRGRGHSDAAKRIADTVTLHWIAGGWENTINKWMAFDLGEGRSDDTLYNSKIEAVTHQKGSYQRYMYLCMAPNGMSICEAEVMLELHRKARERDIASPDIDHPTGGRDLIPRIGVQELNNQLRSIRGK